MRFAATMGTALATAWPCIARCQAPDACIYVANAIPGASGAVLPREADIVVIGSGAAGIAAARRILAANPMLLRMLGLSCEADMNDVNIASDLYVDPNVRKRLLERLERDGSFQNIEYQLRRRDGMVITVQENARAPGSR